MPIKYQKASHISAHDNHISHSYCENTSHIAEAYMEVVFHKAIEPSES